jgi:prolyl oligopeptidase
VERYQTFFESDFYLASREGALTKIPVPADAIFEALIGTRAFFLLQEDLTVGPRTFAAGSLVAYPLAEGDQGLTKLDVVFAPSAKRFLSGVARSGSDLLLNVLDNVRGKVLRAHLGASGWELTDVAIGGADGVAAIAEGSAFDGAYLATYTDFLTPTTQYLGDARGASALRASPAFFDASRDVVEQLDAVSKDGTHIPYFVVHRRDMPLDGTNPTLLYGYGGFNIPETPWYSATIGKAWLERGGVFAVANIRGGGEFGPAWHEAARKEKHQNAFDDFIAVAESLIARKVTSPSHLGIEGGSNGGLLMGAVTTQRPDLFNAVLCEVPLLDMMRYHLLLAGNSWIDEYGNPDVSAEREYILKYSPYQNVRAGVKYPEVFFTTSTHDDRVHPGHARKMAALMESLGTKVYFYENNEGGHGGSATPEQTARLKALEYSYLWGKLGQ